ncbi:hypothetical protein [Thiomicrospira pelophila]|uniref:Nmad2 family putative nucleotide modification protein n=1 Tax=Thiomicrospira pelophila TaxID=934 RepID=UPI00068A64F4|nr:hypothetical protein [Thiomicrospira pelophila]
MNIFSYVLKNDSGFAPNPFCGFLTLATCKPVVRRVARPGDILVGTGSVKSVGAGRLVYAGVISEVVSLEEYGCVPRFNCKQPSEANGEYGIHGDSIYFFDGNDWVQSENPHHSSQDLESDIGGQNVLICERFWYFGSGAIEIPQGLQTIVKKGPGHKRIRDESVVSEFLDWVSSCKIGIHGLPEIDYRCGQSIKGCSVC